MIDNLLFAGPVLVPLVFGLVPAFLPTGASAPLRWGLWLALLVLAAWYGNAMQDAPDAYRLLAWASIAASAALSLIVLVFELGRPGRLR